MSHKTVLASHQGDIFLTKIDAVPSHSSMQERDGKGRIVLAFGELTGHAHVIHTPAIKFYKDTGSDGTFYLHAPTAFDLLHEDEAGQKTDEHASLRFEPGVYEVRRQREAPWGESARFVED